MINIFIKKEKTRETQIDTNRSIFKMTHNKIRAGAGSALAVQAFWQRDYWAKDYIERNPITAKLCTHAKDWAWSSAC